MIHCKGSRHGWQLDDTVKGFGIGGDGGFVGGEEGAEVGDGCVAKMDLGRWANGEGGIKVARKGVDEGCVEFMWREIRLIITKKYLAKGGGKLKAHSKLG